MRYTLPNPMAALSISMAEAAHYAPAQYPSCVDCPCIAVIHPASSDDIEIGQWIPMVVCQQHKTAHLHCRTEQTHSDGVFTLKDFRCPSLIRDGQDTVCKYTGEITQQGWCESDDLGYSKFQRARHCTGATLPTMPEFPARKKPWVNSWLQPSLPPSKTPHANAPVAVDDSQISPPAGKTVKQRSLESLEASEGRVKERISKIIEFFTKSWTNEKRLAGDQSLLEKNASIYKQKCFDEMLTAVDFDLEQRETVIVDSEHPEQERVYLDVFRHLAKYFEKTSDWYNGGLVISKARCEWLTEIVYNVGCIQSWVSAMEKMDSRQIYDEAADAKISTRWTPNRNTCLGTTLGVLLLLSNGGYCMLHEEGGVSGGKIKRATKTPGVSVVASSRATMLLPAVPMLKNMLPDAKKMADAMDAWIRCDVASEPDTAQTVTVEYRGGRPTKRGNKIKGLLRHVQQLVDCQYPLRAARAKRHIQTLLQRGAWFSPEGEQVEGRVIRDKLR
jgi:hypothetical protein